MLWEALQLTPPDGRCAKHLVFKARYYTSLERLNCGTTVFLTPKQIMFSSLEEQNPKESSREAHDTKWSGRIDPCSTCLPVLRLTRSLRGPILDASNRRKASSDSRNHRSRLLGPHGCYLPSQESESQRARGHRVRVEEGERRPRPRLMSVW